MKILAVFTASLLSMALLGQANEITVTGTAKTTVNADELVISTGISLEDDDASVLQKKMQERMATAITYLKGKDGVKSVETDMIQIFNRGPQHKRGSGLQYQGRQTVTVILTDLELYDELMIKLFELGFNNIRSVHFSLSDPAVEKQKVQLMAIQVAKEKAQLFARELGVELGPVSSFAEQGVHYQPVKICQPRAV